MSDLVQIQTFVEVVNSGSFAEASRRLTLPRSTVSARVKGLESRLNTRLFNRNTRNVSLTSEGQTYLASCQQALVILNQAEDKLAKPNDLSGKIRFSVPVATSKRTLAKVIAAFKQMHPNIDVETIVTDEKLNLVANNIDLAIRGRDVGDLDLIAREFYKTSLAYYASPTLFQKIGGGASLHCLSQHLIFAPEQFSKRFKFLTQDFELALELACCGQGVVCLPEAYSERAVSQGKLKKFSMRPSSSNLTVYLVYANREYMANRIRCFINFLLDNKNQFANIV